MTVLQSIEELKRVPGPVALAIGVFDGLHLGHQEVIRAAQEHAAQHRGTAVVMTFEPHPLRVLRPAAAPKLLNGVGYQGRLLGRMGIEWSLLCPFTETTAATPAEDFVGELVQACRPLGCISVGYTWVFGKDRRGNIHSLMDLGQRHDFAVYGVPPIRVAGEVVSSTLIRDAVSAGDLARASRMLGRPYGLFGRVIEGCRLGRELGFPTANLRPEGDLLPPFGVYAVRIEIDGEWLRGIANLGVRPTVENDGIPTLEVHVFDWSGDLYAQDLEVRLEAFIRPEMKFAGVEALKEQITADVLQARSLR
ncbi:MAG: bifunctional riboflavin kinase/FAD synthetase [Prosthecobacter sp.]|nr:bifunctional riboflavin kinase/FAD synthetase [Prosthecobacter sp.]